MNTPNQSFLNNKLSISLLHQLKSNCVMDHLPVPRSPVRPNIEVPFICQISHDGQGFEGFPRRCGYEIEEGGYVRPRGFDQEMIIFYQTWLYFGLMTEFFQHPIETGDLSLSR